MGMSEEPGKEDFHADDVRQPPPRDPRYFWLGVVLTAAYVIGMGFYAIVQFHHFRAMDPNEFGDFLGGVFGPLALLWVVLGFLQQGAELRYSRQTLELQAKELANSVSAQRDLVGVGRDQVEQARRAVDAQTVAAIEAIRPMLVIRTEEERSAGGILWHIYRLTNSGSDAFKITMQFQPIEGLEFIGDYVPELPTGEVHKFVIKHPQGDAPNRISINLSCRDKTGREWRRRYQLRGHRTTLPVVDGFGEPLPLTES